MGNFLNAIGANPIDEVKKNDSLGTKFLKNVGNAAVNRAALTPLLGAGPLAVAAPIVEGAVMTATDKSIWNKGPIMKAIGRDLGIIKTPSFHSETKITGPTQLTQDQKNLQNLFKVVSEQQAHLKKVRSDISDISQDLYGDTGV